MRVALRRQRGDGRREVADAGHVPVGRGDADRGERRAHARLEGFHGACPVRHGSSRRARGSSPAARAGSRCRRAARARDCCAAALARAGARPRPRVIAATSVSTRSRNTSRPASAPGSIARNAWPMRVGRPSSVKKLSDSKPNAAPESAHTSSSTVSASIAPFTPPAGSMLPSSAALRVGGGLAVLVERPALAGWACRRARRP